MQQVDPVVQFRPAQAYPEPRAGDCKREPTVTPINAAISSRPVPRSTRFWICWIRSGVNFNGLPLETGLLNVPTDTVLTAGSCTVNPRPRAVRRRYVTADGRVGSALSQAAAHRFNAIVLGWHLGAEETLFSDIPDSPSRMGAVRPPA
jgi:hypothetical protein